MFFFIGIGCIPPLVTGSSRGIGAGAVIRLAEHGADVVINYFSSPKLAEEVAGKCRALGVRALVVQADVSKQTEVVRLFEQAVKEFGQLDIVFSNSGIEHWGKPDEIDEAQIDKVDEREFLFMIDVSRSSMSMLNLNSSLYNKRTNI